MTQKKKLVFSWMLILTMVISVISPTAAVNVKAAETTGSLSDTYAEKLEGVTKYLKTNTDVTSTYSYGFEWRIMQQARQGKDEQKLYKTYLDSVEAMLKEGKTELYTNNYATLTIALTSIGADPTNIGGKNLLEGFADYSALQAAADSYVDPVAFALIALDSKNYDIPKTDAKEAATRDKIVKLLAGKLDATTGLYHYKSEYGGVVYEGDSIDSTGAILQALAPYYSDNKDVKAIVDKSLNTLSKQQRTDGAFGGDYDDRVCSTAQVVVALTALGINPEKDSRFVKNGISPVDAILAFYDSKTGAIAMEGAYNPLLSCEQAGYALAAYDRVVNKKTSLYDMSDVDYKLYTKLKLSKPSLKKVTSPKKKQIKATWKKIKTVTGYELQVSASSKFKNAKTFKVKKAAKTSTIMKKSIKSGKKYFVRMRTYKTKLDGSVVKSGWSNKKAVTTK